MIAPEQEQTVPVRIYRGDDRLMVAAPMPGLEPEDISVTVKGDVLTIRGQYRGPRQQERDLIAAEWAIGPYFRDLRLPEPVNGALTNATYGNGVLVLVLPKLQAGQQTADNEFRLEVISATRGEHVAHSGREMRQTTTQEHREQVAEVVRGAHEGRGTS
jgi:HSP20 family protein